MKNYTLSTQAAAALLASRAGDTQEQWETRLRNWRKPDRSSPLSWSVDTPRPKYDPDEISAFTEERKVEAAVLALRHADPLDDLPKAEATCVRNDEARPLVQISWADQNTSGALMLALEAAKRLSTSLAQAIADAESCFQKDFDTAMDADLRALDMRTEASGPDGALPSLVDIKRMTRLK